MITFGALLTVAALAIDPFSQQVIKYDDCAFSMPQYVARIPRAETFRHKNSSFEAGEIHSLDDSIKVALYLGLLTPPSNSSSRISLSCVTGNCTFPIENRTGYLSLAMCHSCLDNSTAIVAYQKEDGVGGSADLYRIDSPFGPSLDVGQTLAITARSLVNSSNENVSIFAFDAIMLREDLSPWAFGCRLHPCLNFYRAEVSNSVINETLLWSKELRLDSISGNYSSVTSRTFRKGNLGYSDLFFGPPECQWGYTNHDAKSIANALTNDFFHNQNLTTARDHPSTSRQDGPAWLLKLSLKGTATIDSVDTYMAGLANSITASIRQQVGNEENYAEGTTYGWQTCIRVRWAWLSLPAILLLLTILFFVITMAETHTPWKSSALALLLHGFDDATKQELELTGKLQDLHDVGRKLRAQRHRTIRGWKFVKA